MYVLGPLGAPRHPRKPCCDWSLHSHLCPTPSPAAHPLLTARALTPPLLSRGRRRREPLLSPYLGQTVPGGQQICLWGPGEQQPLGRGPSMHCSGRAGGLVQVRWASATLPRTSEPSPRAARAPARSRRSPAPSAPSGWLTTPPCRRLPDPPLHRQGTPPSMVLLLHMVPSCCVLPPVLPGCLALCMPRVEARPRGHAAAPPGQAPSPPPGSAEAPPRKASPALRVREALLPRVVLP